MGVSVFDYITTKYECPECAGKTKLTPRTHNGQQRVYVDHRGGCETAVRNQMLATRFKQGVIKNAN
jgi:hypothetical protein